jgi:hypothetical protein
MLKDKKMGHKSSRRDFPYLRFIPCKVEPGLFRGEYLVHVQGIDRSGGRNAIPVQLFVDENVIKNLSEIPQQGKPATGLLRVALAGVSKDLARVVLPQPAAPVGESMFVKRSDLVEEGAT